MQSEVLTDVESVPHVLEHSYVDVQPPLSDVEHVQSVSPMEQPYVDVQPLSDVDDQVFSTA